MRKDAAHSEHGSCQIARQSERLRDVQVVDDNGPDSRGQNDVRKRGAYVCSVRNSGRVDDDGLGVGYRETERELDC